MQPGTARSPRRLLGRYDYPTHFRIFEVASLAVFAAFAAVFVARIAGAIADRLAVELVAGIVVAAVVAFLLADFLSGLVHFLCDNLGSPSTPFVGQKFIKAFREHHDDPEAMTQGDFVEVNADNFFVCLPVLVPSAMWLDVDDHLHLAVFLAVLVLFVTVTNELHKWAHMPRAPRVLGVLQHKGGAGEKIEHQHNRQKEQAQGNDGVHQGYPDYSFSRHDSNSRGRPWPRKSFNSNSFL